MYVINAENAVCPKVAIITNCYTTAAATFAAASRDRRIESAQSIVSSFAVLDRQANNHGPFRNRNSRDPENLKSRFGRMLSRSRLTVLFENQIGEDDMTIYAWPGVAVEIVEAKMAPLWVERQPSRIRHHFKEPKRTRLTKELTATVGWYAKLKSVEDGRMLYGGKWADVFTLKADNGWEEIDAAFGAKVGQDEIDKFKSWRTSDGPEMTSLFPLANAKEMAA